MRSVTLMFDRLITWFTPERRVLLAFPAELALALVVGIGVLVEQPWWSGGTIEGSLNVVSAIAFGSAVALYRVRPALSIGSLVVGGVCLVLTFLFGAAPTNPWTYVAAALVLFGTAAFGGPTVRIIGLALSVFASAVGLVTLVAVVGVNYDAGLAFIVSQGLSVIGTTVFAVIPWVLGELVRASRKRRALSAAVETVSTERDAALTRADLEAERTRVARDVHDIVAHSLTVVIAQADGARYATAGDSPAAADAFGTIAQTARDALADVRSLLTELRHTQEAGPQPGIQNLDALVDSFRDSGLALTVHEFGDRGGLTDARELALYRIVQESLTNALRHGDGAATLDLDWGDASVDLLVTNVAAAPAPASADAAATVVTHGDHQPERGHGIDGMRERAILAGGEFSIREGATFRVRARLPREPREHSQPEAATPDTIDTEVFA